MQIWRTPLFDLIHESQITVRHRLELFYLADTTWADRIAECLPVLVDQRLFSSLISQLTRVNTQCPLEELHAIVPLQSTKQLLEKYRASSSIPSVDLPSIAPDVDGLIWIDRAINESGLVYEEGTILWMSHRDSLIHYADLRRDQPSLILKSFQLAMDAYLRTRQSTAESPDNRPTQPCKFPTPKGTIWEEITITFVSNESIRIKARDVTRTYPFSQIGFRDHRRIDKPNSIWKLFDVLSTMNGHLDWKALDRRGRTVHVDQKQIQKRISILRKLLQNLIGLSDDPFYPYRKRKAYEARFSLRDERPLD